MEVVLSILAILHSDIDTVLEIEHGHGETSWRTKGTDKTGIDLKTCEQCD